MTVKAEYLAELASAIRLQYKCSAIHCESVYVHEKTASGETVWLGNVEVFELTGCDRAHRCYAWPDFGNGIRMVTILESKLIDSAERAVQAAIFSGTQSPMTAEMDEEPPLFMPRSEAAREHFFRLVTRRANRQCVKRNGERSSSGANGVGPASR